MVNFETLLFIPLDTFMSVGDVRFNTPAIYGLRCLPNGKVYVGSAKRLAKRLSVHCSALRRNRHHSPLLQRSFNKYGASAFHVLLLEACEEQNLIPREQWYIDNLKACDPCFGFNTNEVAGRTILTGAALERVRLKKSKPFRLEKDGEIFEGVNLNRFAAERGLSSTSLYGVIHGKTLLYKGYHLPGAELPPPHQLQDPTGQIHTFRNIRAFALEHGLTPCSVVQVLNRKPKYSHTQGWKLPGVLLKSRTFKLNDPDGVVHEFENMTQFAKQFGLTRSNISKLLSGAKGYQSVKGWTKAV